MGLAAAQRTDCCWLLLFLLLQCPGLGCVGANRKSGQTKKRSGIRTRVLDEGPSCRDGLWPSRTFPPLAVPSLAVSSRPLPSRSAMLVGPLVSQAGGARSMSPNSAPKVPPGPHRRHANSCPREREGGYRPIPPDLPGGYKPPERLLLLKSTELASRKTIRRREPGRYGKIVSDHRQDSNVAKGAICNLAPWGPSAVSGNKQKHNNVCTLRKTHTFV